MLTLQQLQNIVPYMNRARAPDILKSLNEVLPKYGINTPARVAGFLGQVVPESGSFNFQAEIWTNSRAQKSYQGRMGNTRLGDGFLFRGRSYIQITGRDGYARMGKILGLDLLRHPELLELPENSVRASCEYFVSRRRVWTSRNIVESITGLELCDRGDWLGLSRFVNGSVKTPNALAHRLEYSKRALNVLRDVNLKPEAKPTPVPPRAPAKNILTRVFWNAKDITGHRGELLITPDMVGHALVVNAKNPEKTEIGFKKEGHS